MVQRTLAEINAKIQARAAVVWTAAELKARVKEWGIARCARTVDVITTGTFEPMEASGAILNLGQTDPPIKLQRCWLDGVPAYTGFGAVDVVIGASQPSELEGSERGGGHVIADLIAGQAVTLKATGYATDCYPRASLETRIRKDTINQFYLYNPRNLYQNFIVGVNGGDRTLYTYLGPLLPQLGNAVYACGGALSPLLNDPDLRCVGIGTRIFLGGGVGYIAWEGTQHFPLQKRLPNRIPIGPAATVALIGDAHQMDSRWVRGCFFKHYGPSLYLGVGVPFPVLDEQVIEACAVQDEDIVVPVVDFAIPRRVRPTFGLVTYAQLKSGRIMINGTSVRTAPLVSISWSLEVAEILKRWIEQGTFTLTEPVAPLPRDRTFLPQDGLD
ncbi:MAG: homocysteine biosynthesis protein [Gloeomargarita sp. SKYG116]|nr:homocysteine biosynthesis protein [Gloeomargarita sp. SKYG116]MDW8401861.1 homocysteine biosynthesis protein [Gloeomargarita sp. SKYGB_i_bin116]